MKYGLIGLYSGAQAVAQAGFSRFDVGQNGRKNGGLASGKHAKSY